MASKFSAKDIDQLGSALVARFKSELINEIKKDLISEIKSELKAMVATEVASKTKDLETKIDDLTLQNTQLKVDVCTLNKNLDNLEQYGRRMCVDISGIKGDSGSPSEKVEEKFLKLLENVKIDGDPVNINSSDIDRIHRKGKYEPHKTRKVIVKFTNSKARQSLFQVKKQLGHGVYVQDNLTIQRECISYEARQLVKNKKLSKTWVAGGNVYGIKDGMSTKIHITDLSVIESLK